MLLCRYPAPLGAILPGQSFSQSLPPFSFSSQYLEQDTPGTSALSAGFPPVSDQMSSDLWQRLCFKSYPLLAEQFTRNFDEQPESWRDQYFVRPCPL